MIKILIKAMYSAFVSVVLISAVLASWTCYAFISQSSKSSEIINVIEDMYSSQKSFVIDVIDLSKILLKDTSENLAKDNNDVLVETELLTNLEDNSQLYESSNAADNGDNPLGIVIESSPTALKDEISTEIIDGKLVNGRVGFSTSESEMGIDMN